MALNFNKDELKAAFDKHANDRGTPETLNLIEFGAMFIELVGHDKGYQASDIEVMFEGVKGNDEEVTFEEFWNAITAKPVTPNQLQDSFNQFDKDGNGTLTKDEVTAMFNAMANKPSDEAIQKALDAVDANDDGKISIEEFMAQWE